MTTPTPTPMEEADARARRQLRQLLIVLAMLDISVLVLVVGLAVAGSAFGLTNVELLISILAGVGLVLVTRVWLAARLQQRSGDLY